MYLFFFFFVFLCIYNLGALLKRKSKNSGPTTLVLVNQPSEFNKLLVLIHRSLMQVYRDWVSQMYFFQFNSHSSLIYQLCGYTQSILYKYEIL